MKTIILKGILAGILISIGCLVYLSVGEIFGAVLFSFGLTSVILTQSKLFTGLAGFCNCYKDYKVLIISLICNFIGCFIVGSLVDTVDATAIITNRLNSSYLHLLIYSIGTGIIMSVSVKFAKEQSNFIPLLLGIPTFILCGMPHCIADICYYSIEGWKITYILPWIISILGNFIGCNVTKIIK